MFMLIAGVSLCVVAHCRNGGKCREREGEREVERDGLISVLVEKPKSRKRKGVYYTYIYINIYILFGYIYIFIHISSCFFIFWCHVGMKAKR